MASWGAGQRFRESLDRTPGSTVLLLHLDLGSSKHHDTHAMSGSGLPVTPLLVDTQDLVTMTPLMPKATRQTPSQAF